MIRIILTAGNETAEIFPKDNLTIPRGNINDNLQHEESRCTFSIPYDELVLRMLIYGANQQ